MKVGIAALIIILVIVILALIFWILFILVIQPLQATINGVDGERTDLREAYESFLSFYGASVEEFEDLCDYAGGEFYWAEDVVGCKGVDGDIGCDEEAGELAFMESICLTAGGTWHCTTHSAYCDYE